MCLTALGIVSARDGDEAIVVTEAGSLRCSALIAPETLPGDVVLVGLGNILRRLTPDEASDIVHARSDRASGRPDPDTRQEVLP